MKILIFLSLFFFGGKLFAQEKIYLHDFPTKEKIEITFNSFNESSKDTLAKEMLFILLNDKESKYTPDLLIAELNKRIYGLKVNNLIFKP